MAAAELVPDAGEPASGRSGTPPAAVPGQPCPLGDGQAWPGSPGLFIRAAGTAEAFAEARPVKLSILMPAFNEERTIAQAVSEVLHTEYPCEVELIIVDDGSTDGTTEQIAAFADPRLRVHRHSANRGKGAALMTALTLATGTHVLPFDADLEYSPEDIPRMLEPVLRGRAAVVYGARLFGVNTVYRSYRYALGNRMLTNMANVLFNAWITDLHTCFKLMPVTVMRGLKLRENGFGLDTELTALLLRQGIRPFEVPVSYYGRSHAQGKKITWRDGVVCARVLLRVRLTGWARRVDTDEQPGDQQPNGHGLAAPAQPSSLTAAPLSSWPSAPEGANPFDDGDGLTVSVNR